MEGAAIPRVLAEQVLGHEIGGGLYSHVSEQMRQELKDTSGPGAAGHAIGLVISVTSSQASRPRPPLGPKRPITHGITP